MDFAYRVVAAPPDYLKVILTADEGPLSTRDYRVVLEAVAVDDGATFIHFTYSYAYGIAGRLAMQTYLGTIGRSKVGFTVVGTQSDGRPLHIGGMRGLVERNTMRYYLAIEAFLGALSVPPQARLEKSLRDWFAAIERHPRQLHELEQSEYLAMKRREYSRVQAEARTPARPTSAPNERTVPPLSQKEGPRPRGCAEGLGPPIGFREGKDRRAPKYYSLSLPELLYGSAHKKEVRLCAGTKPFAGGARPRPCG